MFPNKGGLCISLNIYGTFLTFVSCHLTAHEGAKKCQMRNDSVVEILGGIRSGWDKRFDPSITSHHTIVMGDLNYRTTFAEISDRDTSKRYSQTPPKQSKYTARYIYFI